MRCFVTGAAGFIGSNLVDELLTRGHEVVGYDNISTGRREFLGQACSDRRFRLIEGDLLNPDLLASAMRDCDFVFHLAANADVRFGTQHPRKDLEQNTVATFSVLEAMRSNGVRQIAFASTGSIYGEPVVFPTPENVAFPVQTSLYGASKLAGEALIQAYCEGFGFTSYVFRFVSVLGERYSHGHIFDFYKMLRQNPAHLKVLGDGHQRKSYMHVRDCIDAVLLAIELSKEKINIFNLGTDEHCEVNQSVAWIIDYLGLKPEIIYTGGKRGWVGDNTFIYLDCGRIRALGWKPKLSIRDGVIRTLDFLRKNQWLFDARS